MEKMMKTYVEWRAITEELMGEYPGTSVDCGESSVREDFSNYAELVENISFEDMFKLEKEYENTLFWGKVKKEINRCDYEICTDLFDKETGECTVDISSGKWAGYSVPAQVIFGEEEDELVIEDWAVIYNAAYDPNEE